MRIEINVRKREFEVKNFFAKSAMLLISRSIVMATMETDNIPNKNPLE